MERERKREGGRGGGREGEREGGGEGGKGDVKNIVHTELLKIYKKKGQETTKNASNNTTIHAVSFLKK